MPLQSTWMIQSGRKYIPTGGECQNLRGLLSQKYYYDSTPKTIQGQITQPSSPTHTVWYLAGKGEDVQEFPYDSESLGDWF
jgi:hypothetical protein